MISKEEENYKKPKISDGITSFLGKTYRNESQNSSQIKHDMAKLCEWSPEDRPLKTKREAECLVFYCFYDNPGRIFKFCLLIDLHIKIKEITD